MRFIGGMDEILRSVMKKRYETLLIEPKEVRKYHAIKQMVRGTGFEPATPTVSR
jgi:ASC-1-like (ASCH) protein